MRGDQLATIRPRVTHWPTGSAATVKSQQEIEQSCGFAIVIQGGSAEYALDQVKADPWADAGTQTQTQF